MRLIAFCFAIALALLPVTASASTSCSVTFSEKDLSIFEYVHGDDTFDCVGLSSTLLRLSPVGFPSLPAKRMCFLIPQDRTCTSVNVSE